MKDYTNAKKKNQMSLLIIWVATLIVALVGATFAFFTVSDVVGNGKNNAVSAATASYGNTIVEFFNGENTLSIGTVELPINENGTDYKYLMKFSVRTDAATSQQIAITWQGPTDGGVRNDFCRYAVTQNANECAPSGMSGACNGVPTDLSTNCSGTWVPYVDVSNDVSYKLYECSLGGYNSSSGNMATKTVNVDSGCQEIAGGASGAIPEVGSMEKLHNAFSLAIPASGIKYYALELAFTNSIEKQNYNQIKTFEAGILVSTYY